MGKVITVWGSPGSGKSMFCCILAKALTRDKRKAIIINTLAFVDKIIIKPKCPRNVTTLGHFKKIYSGHPEITVRRNILHDFLDRLIVK